METTSTTINSRNNPFESFQRQFQSYMDSSSISRTQTNDEYDKLMLYYKEKKEQQGFIGKIWDRVKIALNFKNNSKTTENTLENYKNNNNNENYNASVNAVNDYAKSQNSALIVTRNSIASVLSTLGIFLLSKSKAGSSKFFLENALPLKIALGGFLGSISAFLVKKADAKSANREYSKDEVKNDILKGATQGALTVCAEYITNIFKIGNKFIKSALKKANKTAIIALMTLSESHKKPPLMLVSAKIVAPEKYDKIEEKIEKSKIKDTDKISFYGEEENSIQ